MRRLMLLRHAKTERNAPTGRDQDRRLDERGHQDTIHIATWLAEHNYLPDLALVSTATRALETWALLARKMPVTQIQYVPELYNADASGLLEIIHSVAAEDPRHLLIVAHNPGLQELALNLITEGKTAECQALAVNLPTTGIVVIDFAIKNWNDVQLRQGKLTLFASPKLLKEASGSDPE
jgi:phosphohistidine phosphatase